MGSPLQPHSIFASIMVSALVLGCSGAAYGQTADPVISVDQLFQELRKSVGGDGPFGLVNRGSVVEADFEPRNLAVAKVLNEKYGKAVQVIVGHLLYPEDTLAPKSIKYCRTGQKISKGSTIAVVANGATIIAGNDKIVTITVKAPRKTLRELRTARILVLNDERTVIATDYGFTDGVGHRFFVESSKGPKPVPHPVTLSTASCLPGQQHWSLSPGKYRAVAEFTRAPHQPTLISNYFNVLVQPS